MSPHELPSVSVSPRGDTGLGSDPLRTVVWVRGEHDIATRGHLSVIIAEAARQDDADIVVDLSGVTFMDASTIGALVVADDRFRACSRSLSVRAPSPLARRLLDLCGLAGLIDAHPAPPPASSALDSWVAVPASDHVSGPTEPLVTHEEPARATPRRSGAPGELVEQRRAPS